MQLDILMALALLYLWYSMLEDCKHDLWTYYLVCLFGLFIYIYIYIIYLYIAGEQQTKDGTTVPTLSRTISMPMDIAGETLIYTSSQILAVWWQHEVMYCSMKRARREVSPLLSS